MILLFDISNKVYPPSAGKVLVVFRVFGEALKKSFLFMHWSAKVGTFEIENGKARSNFNCLSFGPCCLGTGSLECELSGKGLKHLDIIWNFPPNKQLSWSI